MKTLGIILAVICMGSAAVIADEIDVSLDRAIMLEPPPNQADEMGCRIALLFEFPEEVDNSEIIYAELTFPLDLSQMPYEGDSILEIQARNITSEWTEENPDCFNDLDSNTYYAYTTNMQNDRAVYLDITEYIRTLAVDEAENYGLMLVPFKYDQQVFNLPPAVISLIMNSAQIKIIYE